MHGSFRRRARLLLGILALAMAIAAQTGDRTVYRGKTGTKYHVASCSTLKGKGIPIRLSEAKKQGREPCKVCKPGR